MFYLIEMRLFKHIFKAAFPIGIVLCCLMVNSCGKNGFGSRYGKIKCRVSSVSTKGTVITTDNIKSSPYGTFTLSAYALEEYTDPDYNKHAAGQYFTTGVSYDSASESWLLASEQLWISQVPITFWSVAPVSVPNRYIDYAGSEIAGELKFDYELPVHTSANDDATAQDDLIFAWNEEERDFSAGKNPSDFIDIHFYHALSQVRFAVSAVNEGYDADGTFSDRFEIRDITLGNVASSGSGRAIAGTPLDFEWTSLGEPASFTQTYNANFSDTEDRNVSGWTAGTMKRGSDYYGLYTCTNVFFLFPQDFSENKATLTVTFYDTLAAATIVRSVELDDKWDAGYYYTYKINFSAGDPLTLGIQLVDWDVIDVDMEF